MANDALTDLASTRNAMFGELEKNWGWPLISGLVSVLLGGMILAQWPQSGLWIIGLFIAIELLLNGWSYLFIALAARTAAKQRRTAGGTQAA